MSFDYLVMTHEEFLELFGEPIDTTPVPTKQLLAEGWPVDENGKDMTNGMYGKKHSQRTLSLLSEQKKGHKQKEITVMRRVAKNIGQKRSAEQRRNLALGQIDNPKAPTLIMMRCDVCDKEMNMPNYNRWHKDCKVNESLVG
jgi:poly-gamma-glutamate capsule biosynthesis protein CapA/YwtB (metallophosphatase superfamily)|tara:strand:+ start:3921 stop:4346 length:426 start_codon:yes stop_codon:yes gene_type:complete